MAEPLTDPAQDPIALALRAARWRALVDAREAQVARLTGAASGPPAPVGPQAHGHWDVRAAAFDAYSRAHDLARDPMYRLLARVAAGRRLLDVGAGTGRYAVPLAGIAEEVTAVEPSAGMRERLGARLTEEGRTNVRVVAGTWPDASDAVEPHDVVLVSHAIYGTRDIVGFLAALERAAPLRVVALRVEPMGARVAGLFCRLHGEPAIPDPTLDTLLPVLLAGGRLPSVRIAPYGGGGTFATVEAAADWSAEQLRLAEDDARRDGLAEMLLPLLEAGEDGWRWRQPLHAGIVAWGADPSGRGGDPGPTP